MRDYRNILNLLKYPTRFEAAYFAINYKLNTMVKNVNCYDKRYKKLFTNYIFRLSDEVNIVY